MKSLLLILASLLAATPAFAADITGTGKVVRVDAGKHAITLKHDPIPSLGWPGMTMHFAVQEDVPLSGYKAGDAVSFTLTPQGQQDYILSGIRKDN